MPDSPFCLICKIVQEVKIATSNLLVVMTQSMFEFKIRIMKKH